MEERYSYSKTKSFWEVFDTIISNSTKHSIEYAIAVRDKAVYQLSYSFGVRPQEVICMTTSDIEIIPGEECKLFINSRKHLSVVRSVFPKADTDIILYLNQYRSSFSSNTIAPTFVTTGGYPLTIPYLNKRLRYYNSKIAEPQRIKHLAEFRRLYIYDLLRIRGLPQSFINHQIGTSAANNILYYYINYEGDKQ